MVYSRARSVVLKLVTDVQSIQGHAVIKEIWYLRKT